MRLIKLAPKGANYDFIGWRKYAFWASGAALALSLLSMATIGLNFGIDFRGGAVVEAKFEQKPDLGDIRAVVSGLGLGDTAVQEIGEEAFGDELRVLIRVEPQGDEEEAVGDGKASATEVVAEALKSSFQGVSIERIQQIGPKVSGELVQAGVVAVAAAVLLVLLYIWLRFEWQFSLGAVAALAHDVVVTIGVFSLLQLEFTLAIIAALLTIVGYSLNDTVVVFDRIRENLRRYKSAPIPEVLNRSINETMSRTVMTSVTTLIALVALFVLGGAVLRGFTFAMIWGVIVGTYSSVFIASPILNALGLTRGELEKDKTVSREDGSMPLGEDGTPLL